MKKNMLAAAGILVLAGLFFLKPLAALEPTANDYKWLRQTAGDECALLYWSVKQLYLVETETEATETVAGAANVPNGHSMEFSRDGSKFAFIQGTTAYWRNRKGDKTNRRITTGVSAGGGIHWYDDDEVLVVKSGKWRRVQLNGTDKGEVAALTALGTSGTEFDVKQRTDGAWLAICAEWDEWRASDGEKGGTGGDCSTSFSVHGLRATGLLHGHKFCHLVPTVDSLTLDSLEWTYDFNAGKGFDNHRYSSNHPEFVACQDEKYNYMVVMKVGGLKAVRVGKLGSGEMYGDLTVGSGSSTGISIVQPLTAIPAENGPVRIFSLEGRMIRTVSDPVRSGMPVRTGLYFMAREGLDRKPEIQVLPVIQ